VVDQKSEKSGEIGVYAYVSLSTLEDAYSPASVIITAVNSSLDKLIQFRDMYFHDYEIEQIATIVKVVPEGANLMIKQLCRLTKNARTQT